MAAGISKTLWSMDDIVALIDARTEAPEAPDSLQNGNSQMSATRRKLRLAERVQRVIRWSGRMEFEPSASSGLRLAAFDVSRGALSS